MKPMRVRIYSPECPLPLRDGASQVIFGQWEALEKLGHQVELVWWLGPGDGFVRLECEAPENPGRAERWMRVLRSLFSGHASPELYYYPLAFTPRREERFGKVDLEIFHYSFAYRHLSAPKAKRLGTRTAVHFHNLESELFTQRANNSRGIEKKILERNARLLKAHELELADRADELWFLSSRDYAEWMRAKGVVAGPALCRVVGPVLSLSRGEGRRVRFLRGRAKKEPGPLRVGFLGRMDYHPNRLGAEWLLDKVAPLLQEAEFQGRLELVGRDGATLLKSRSEPFAFVEISDFLDHIDSFWDRIDFLLVPHLQGAGVRIKLVEALEARIPVLAMSGAAEGLSELMRSSPGLIVSDSAEDWARILCDPGTIERRRAFSALDVPSHPEENYRFLTENLEPIRR